MKDEKVIAIYFSDPEPMGYPFHKKEYFEMYQWLVRELNAQGITVYIVRGNTYKGKGIFSDGFLLRDSRIIAVGKTIRASLIFNRDDKNTIPEIYDCPIINHPLLDSICTDKYKTYELFPDISPRTAVVHSFGKFGEIIKHNAYKSDELIVLKKNYLTEGRGIFILPIADIHEGLYSSWENVLVQEFIDSSIGISGLVEGHHDIRVTVVDGKPINSFIRTPAKGMLLANVSLGGTGRSISLENVPSVVLEKVHEIIFSFKKYSPSLFAADFMNSTNGFKLVELNSRPGIQHENWSSTYEQFNSAVLEMLVKAVF